MGFEISAKSANVVESYVAITDLERDLPNNS